MPELIQNCLTMMNVKLSLQRKSDCKRTVSVEQYDQRSNYGNRSWKRDHCCIFCQRMLSKMACHLIDCHRHEAEVRKAYNLPVKSPDRRILLERLMCVGDYYHNMDVFDKGYGDLIVLRLPTEQQHSFISLP